MDWKDAHASKWERAKDDWNEALRHADGKELAALGILVALAVDRLEDLEHAVAQLERGPSA